MGRKQANPDPPKGTKPPPPPPPERYAGSDFVDLTGDEKLRRRKVWKDDPAPEHAKRWDEDAPGNHPDVNRAFNYVDQVIETNDFIVGDLSPTWYGWALREAFLAGISYAENEKYSPESPAVTVCHLRQIIGYAALEGMEPAEVTLADAMAFFDNESEKLRTNSCMDE